MDIEESVERVMVRACELCRYPFEYSEEEEERMFNEKCDSCAVEAQVRKELEAMKWRRHELTSHMPSGCSSRGGQKLWPTGKKRPVCLCSLPASP